MFGTTSALKKDVITEIAATLAFSAIQNNDKVGVIFFSDRIEKFIPPQKGRKHILYIIRELIEFQPQSAQTNIGNALKYLTNVIKKRCTSFLISDFIDTNDYENPLMVASRKHDIAVLKVYDRRDAELPPVGLIRVKDAETGKRIWVDTNSRRLRMMYKNSWEEISLAQRKAMRRAGVDGVSIEVGDDYVKSLMALFNMRK